MAKEKKIDVAPEVPKLNWAQYWEWRTTISEMAEKKAQLEAENLKVAVMRREAEAILLRAELTLKSSLKDASTAYDESQKEYARYKKVLEDCLGVSLNGKLIDEMTLEIRDVPK